MSKDVGVISPVGAPAWLNPVIKDLKAGLRTKQDEGDDLNAIEAVTGSGVLVRTGDNTWALRTLTAPAAGITITNPAGTAGNFIFALANDLAAVEGLSTTGLAVRSAADTWITRAVAGTANEITVTNGDGIAGAPTISLPAAITGTGKTWTGGTFTTIASVSIDDANFSIDILSTVPTITFAASDLFRYDRTANAFQFLINSATIFTITAAGCTIGEAGDAHTINGTTTIAGSLIIDDANFNLDVTSSNPTITVDTNDSLRYSRSTNTFIFRIGSSDILTLNSTGTLSLGGTAGRFDLIDRDGDDGSPWVFYNQTNTLRFYRGSDLMTIDASGNVDIAAEARCNSLRIDATPSASAATTTHKLAVNLNGSTYYLLLSNV